MNKKYIESLEKKYSQFQENYDYIKDNNYEYGWNTLVNSFIANKYYVDAINLGKKIFKKSDRESLSYIYLAEIYQECNEISSAITLYEDALNNNLKSITSVYAKYAKLAEKYYKEDRVIEIYSSYINKKNLCIYTGIL